MANVFAALDAEWQTLRRSSAAAATLREVCREAGGGRSLTDVEAYMRDAAPADADRVLLALVARVVGPSADGEPAAARLAARVLLQLLLPGTRRIARKWWALGDRDEQSAAAVAAVYHRIRTYPLDRRPGRVAANILMDASNEMGRLVPRLVTTPVEDPTTVTRQRATADARNAAEELAEVLVEAVAAGTIRRSDAEIIARSRIADDTMQDIARDRQRSARTLWHHRNKAEAALGLAAVPGS